MPKTRDQQWQVSIGLFMEAISQKVSPDGPPLKYRTLPLWASGKKEMRYRLSIEDRISHTDVSGNVIYEDVNGLTDNFLRRESDKFFEPYFTCNARDQLITWCEIQRDQRGISREDHTIKIYFEVCYHNRHPLPFPTSRPNEAIGIQMLTEAAQNEYEYIIESVEKANAKLEKQLERTKQFIREQYAQQQTWSDCPVCYSEILPESLIVNDCCHLICSSCDDRCDRCPICRC